MIVCVTEKPSVAESISKVLGAKTLNEGYYEGNGYQITWAFGHLCELKAPYEYNSNWFNWNLDTLPMLPNKFGIKIKDDEGVKKQFAIIKKLCKKAKIVINCGDAGQEGEVIQRWIYQLIGITCPIKRLWVSSLTEEAIKEAFSKLKDNSDYQSLYQAGICRSIGDWLLGMNATRLYTLKYGNDKQVLSIGRVQTPTLAMIVKRQKEIDNFIPEPYWILQTIYKDTIFQATKGKFNSQEEGEKYHKQIEKLPFNITKIESKEGKELPPQLFDLTTLQFECSKNFGFSAEHTLQIVQSLYEKKLTTYPRVDTRYLSNDIYPKCKEIIEQIAGYNIYKEEILSKSIKKSKRVFDSAKVTDHHAIIPTGWSMIGTNLNHDEYITYDLIVRTFLAVFFDDCLFNQNIIFGEVNKIEFKAIQKEVLNWGWKKIYKQTLYQGEGENKEEKKLQHFEVGESGFHKPSLLEKETTPPKFYNDGTLVRAMETAGQFVEDENLREALKKNGIGRPSSRGAIIETLFKREYIRREKGNIVATSIGIKLIDTIDEELLKSPELTGVWERKLRDIEKNRYSAKQFIKELEEQIRIIVKNVLNKK